MRHFDVPAIDLSSHFSCSPCPYAGHNLTKTFGLALTLPDGLPRAARVLRRYSRQTDLHNSSIFAISVEMPKSSNNILSLASIFHYLVYSANSTQLGRNQLYADIREPQWRLMIENTAFFAIVLSPLYPTTHHRHIEPTSLLLFQPESIFTAFGITTGPSRFHLSRAIEARFRNAGRPYASTHKRNVPKSQRIVLTNEGAPISWWRLPLSGIG